jgi:quercetin dioxygenase-like cupin family protein
MPRTATAIAIMLMLLTGIVLGQVYSLGSTRSLMAPVSYPDSRDTAQRFYDAMNAGLESGDTTTLRSILHPDFADHAPLNVAPRTAQDLEDTLMALGQAYPGLRLATSGMVTHGPVVASQLTRIGVQHGTVEGIPLELTTPPAGYDVLRIENGRVIERWASLAFPHPPRVEAVASLDPLAPGISPRTPKLERLTLEPYTGYEVDSHGGTIITVTSGMLNAHVTASTEQSPAVTLAARNSLAIPAHSQFQIKNADLAPATMLVLTIPPFDPGDIRKDDPAFSARPESLPAGISRELLMNGMSISPGQYLLAVTMLQMVIPAGTAIANHRVAESEMLLAIDGAIEVSVQEGALTLMSGPETTSNQSGALALSAGDGIAVPAGAELAWRAIGNEPAFVVLVTVAPGDENIMPMP